MTQHDDVAYLARMLEMANTAQRITQGKTIEDLRNDEVLQLAVTNALSLIGEAARHVSPQVRTGTPNIPWNQVIGMRNRIVHNYFEINFDRVWDTISNDLNPLIDALRGIVPEGPPA
jgi:uncharacterized protein with HEPN domain